MKRLFITERLSWVNNAFAAVNDRDFADSFLLRYDGYPSSALAERKSVKGRARSGTPASFFHHHGGSFDPHHIYSPA